MYKGTLFSSTCSDLWSLCYWTLVAFVNMQMICFPNFGEHVCARSACILTPLTDSMTTWKPSGQLTVNFKWSEALDVTRSHSALPYLHKGTAWREASYTGGKYNIDLRCIWMWRILAHLSGMRYSVAWQRKSHNMIQLDTDTIMDGKIVCHNLVPCTLLDQKTFHCFVLWCTIPISP